MYRKALGLLLTILLTAGASVWASDNQVLAELRFMAHNGAEKKAGVWVDGQYVGFVKELNGGKKMLLLPGKHEIVVRQAWYQDYVEQARSEERRVGKEWRSTRWPRDWSSDVCSSDLLGI